jgi:hypothetical protein
MYEKCISKLFSISKLFYLLILITYLSYGALASPSRGDHFV